MLFLLVFNLFSHGIALVTASIYKKSSNSKLDYHTNNESYTKNLFNNITFVAKKINKKPQYSNAFQEYFNNFVKLRTCFY
jgi:hypothetical protein